MAAYLRGKEINVSKTEDGVYINCGMICTCHEDAWTYWSEQLKSYILGSCATDLIRGLDSMNFYVDGIAADMWIGVTVKSLEFPITVYIECDELEYGLLGAILALEAVYPEIVWEP